MEALVQSRTDLSLRRIDIVSWNSPVSEQFAIRRLPYLLLYDAKGTLIAEGTREVLAAIQ